MITRTATDGSIIWWCPGCNLPHRVTCAPGSPNQWTWNGDRVLPTFTPSVLVTWDTPDGKHTCHSFVTNGEMQFLGDCTHNLANQTVSIPEWPYAPGGFGGIQD